MSTSINFGSDSSPIQNSSIFPSFYPIKDMWHSKKYATSKHHLSPSYPPLSLSNLHSQTHLLYTPTIFANRRQGAIGMVPETPPTNTHGDFHLLRKATW